MSDEQFDLFYTVVDCTPAKDFDDTIKKDVQQMFVIECTANSDIKGLQIKRQSWYGVEEKCIELLAAMIKSINAKYEE